VVLDLATLRSKIEQAGEALRREASDGSRVAEEQEQATLSLARLLIAVVRVVLDETKSASPNHGWPVVVTALLVKAIATVRAAVTVGAAGHAREMGVLVRSALESLINAAFIAKDHSELRAKRWAEYGFVIKAKLLKKQPHLSETAEHVRVREQIMAKAKSLEKDFPNSSFWASGLSKGSLRDLAVDVQMEWYYDFVYWSGSQATHGSAVSVDSYVGLAADETPIYKLGLSIDHLRGELSVCCDILVRVLALLNEVLKLDLDKLVNELSAEYKAAFGDDLLESDPGSS
jgi:hypothetical protein